MSGAVCNFCCALPVPSPKFGSCFLTGALSITCFYVVTFASLAPLFISYQQAHYSLHPQ